MKTFLYTLFLSFTFCFSLPVHAQEGVIQYEVKVNLHRTLTSDQANMKSMMPEFSTSKQALYFNSTASVYKRLVDEEEEADFTSGGGGMRFRFNVGANEIYMEPASQKKISLRDLNGKKYLIEDTLKVLPWKLGADTKVILGYTCKLATSLSKDGKQTIVAWYTEQLRPFLGPESYGSLPGAVLEVDINNGERTTKALKVELRALKKGELVIPAKGEKITEQQFQAMSKEQIERMRQNGGMIIRRQN